MRLLQQAAAVAGEKLGHLCGTAQGELLREKTSGSAKHVGVRKKQYYQLHSVITQTFVTESMILNLVAYLLTHGNLTCEESKQQLCVL